MKTYTTLSPCYNRGKIFILWYKYNENNLVQGNLGRINEYIHLKPYINNHYHLLILTNNTYNKFYDSDDNGDDKFHQLNTWKRCFTYFATTQSLFQEVEFNGLTFKFCSPPSTAILSGCKDSYSLTSTQATVPKPPIKYISLMATNKVSFHTQRHIIMIRRVGHKRNGKMNWHSIQW